MSREQYTPFYCEENVWWLAKDPRFAAVACEVLIVTNARRTVAMFGQRAARSTDRCIVWDYHVVLAVPERGELWDLDCVGGMPLPIDVWIDASFAGAAIFPAQYAPQFRIVSATTYVSMLASDRRHMRLPEGRWRAPPPPWPCIGEGSNLERFLRLDDPAFGAVVELEALRVRYTR